jgi:hypothetical protein
MRNTALRDDGGASGLVLQPLSSAMAPGIKRAATPMTVSAMVPGQSCSTGGVAAPRALAVPPLAAAHGDDLGETPARPPVTGGSWGQGSRGLRPRMSANSPPLASLARVDHAARAWSSLAPSRFWTVRPPPTPRPSSRSSSRPSALRERRRSPRHHRRSRQAARWRAPRRTARVFGSRIRSRPWSRRRLERADREEREQSLRIASAAMQARLGIEHP